MVLLCCRRPLLRSIGSSWPPLGGKKLNTRTQTSTRCPKRTKPEFSRQMPVSRNLPRTPAAVLASLRVVSTSSCVKANLCGKGQAALWYQCIARHFSTSSPSLHCDTVVTLHPLRSLLILFDYSLVFLLTFTLLYLFSCFLTYLFA